MSAVGLPKDASCRLGYRKTKNLRFGLIELKNAWAADVALMTAALIKMLTCLAIGARNQYYLPDEVNKLYV
jgi:hypothetical protein